jgi:hypothetical protein
MPEKTPEKIQEMGLFISGIIIAKNSYVNKTTGETRYQFDIATPGSRHNVTLGVTPEMHRDMQEMQPFASKISVMNIRGNIMFGLPEAA